MVLQGLRRHLLPQRAAGRPVYCAVNARRVRREPAPQLHIPVVVQMWQRRAESWCTLRSTWALTH